MRKNLGHTSGGSMEILIKTYFRRENEITMEKRKVESPLDLCVFILDTLKSLPPLVTDPFLKHPQKGMLMHSPTHAFILHPGWDFIKEGWQDNGFTYTWVRDQFLKPREDFFQKMLLSPSEQRFLVDRLSHNLPPLVAHHSQRAFSSTSLHLTLSDFRDELTKNITDIPFLDSFLYESLPLTPEKDWKDKLELLISKKIKNLPDFPDAYVTRREIEGVAKECLIQQVPPPEFDIQAFVASRSAAIELAPPPPFLFADTNWAVFHFALLVNPGTGQLELWRTDRTGSTGYPMTSWKEWLNGTSPLTWVIYTHPHEYFR